MISVLESTGITVPQHIAGIPAITDLKSRIADAERRGLKGQAKNLKVRLLATALREVGCSLLLTENSCRIGKKDSAVWLYRVGLDGAHRLFSYDALMVPLKNYTGNIPDVVLSRITPKLASKAVVFVLRKDPIIAVRAGWFSNYFISLMEWE